MSTALEFVIAFTTTFLWRPLQSLAQLCVAYITSQIRVKSCKHDWKYRGGLLIGHGEWYSCECGAWRLKLL